MDNKANKDEFLGYINSLWKQGQISENALIKIRNEYCKEKLRWQEVSNDKSQILEQAAEKLYENEFFTNKDKEIQNDFEPEIIKEQYSTVLEEPFSEINNNEIKTTVNKSYDIEKNQTINEKNKVTKERNITTILSLGIFMILLAGLILATSTWGLMSNGVKTIALLMVSILFFVMSSFTEKKLKIIKTSFAFWILGNLFLPVILLSIGFFKLLGNYLSIGGQGRYIYGIISATICLIFFSYSIKKYKNVAFTWITLIDSEILYWFILKQLHFNYNMELLMLLIYTLALSGVYYKLNKKQSLYNFIAKTIKYYALSNIVICILQILGNSFYSTIMIMMGKPNEISQGVILTISIIVLAIVMTYWIYDFKFQGGIFVSSILILAIHMICITFRIKMDVFAYYIIMNLGMLAIYGVVYYYNNFKYLKNGTDIITITTMIILDVISIVPLKALYTAVLIYILLAVIVITAKKARNEFYLGVLKFLTPSTIFIANLFTLVGLKLIENIFSNGGFHVAFIYIILNIGIIYLISLILYLKKKNDYKIYLYEGHTFLALTYFITVFFQIDRIIVGIAAAILTAGCFLLAKSELKIKVYLYLFLTIITIVLVDLEIFLRFNKMNIFILKPQNLFLCISLVLTMIWMWSKDQWRKRLNSYIIGIYSFGFLNSLFLNDFENLNYKFICFLVVCIGLMSLLLYKSKKIVLMYIPIGCYWLMSLRIIYYFDMVNQTVANCFVACIIAAIGYILYNLDEISGHKEILYCNIFSGMSLMFSIISSFDKSIPYVFNIFSLIVFGVFLYYASQFINRDKLKKILNIGAIFFNYIAYGRLIAELDFLVKYKMDFILVPSIIVLHLIIKYSFQKKNNGCAVILRVWYSSVGIILLLLHQNSNSFEAIVFCMLCIISIIVGFVIQKKLYFIGGSIFLLIGVFLNTLNFWLNIPWWIYLLVGGALLIFFASKNEFNKSNKKDKKDNFISKLIKKIKAW
jgi:hypothetical protein